MDTEPVYYIHPRGDGKFDLRQTRYREAFLAGREHPHDIMAFCFSAPEMRDVLTRHFSDARVDTLPLEENCPLPHSHMEIGATCVCGFVAAPMDEEDVRAAHEVSQPKPVE